MTTEIRPLFDNLEPLNEAVAEIANTWSPDDPPPPPPPPAP